MIDLIPDRAIECSPIACCRVCDSWKASDWMLEHESRVYFVRVCRRCRAVEAQP